MAFAAELLVPGVPELDRPTVICLGVRWPFEGDDDGDAIVTLRARPIAGGVWRPGLPVHRVRPEVVGGWKARREFAGSICDLTPDTDWELELHAVDPDCVDTTTALNGHTRPIPGDEVAKRVCR